MENSLCDRATVATDDIRSVRRQIAKYRQAKIEIYLLRMELRACRSRLHETISRARRLTLPPSI
jgi:hypothetical protein